MIMSTSNQRASNMFKSSQEPNTNKKNKQRHNVPFNKIQPPINIPFNLGWEFKKNVSTYEVYRQSSTICIEGWQPRIHSHGPEDPLRTDDQRWPTKKQSSQTSSIVHLPPLKTYYYYSISLEHWRCLEGWFISLKKRWSIYRHQIPPSLGTHQLRDVRPLDRFATERAGGLVCCCGLRLQPPERPFRDFRGVVGEI